MLRRNGPVIKSLESVLRAEESMVRKICERGRFQPKMSLDGCRRS